MKLHIIYIISLMTVISACSNDDGDWREPSGEGLTLRIPIEVVMSQPMMADGTRATGDPGVDDALMPPTNLYVFSWIRKPDNADQYYVCYKSKTNIQPSEWEYIMETGQEQSSRYRYTQDMEVKYEVKPENYNALADKTPVGCTYAVATNRALSDDQIKSILDAGSIPSDWTGTGRPQDDIETVEVDFSGWSGDELRDLYSSPAKDTRKDDRGALNGQIIYSKTDEKQELVLGDVRLYHTAAKIDFTWEVAREIQSTTSVNTITVTGLPTMCKIFEPTANPTNPTNSYLIGGTEADIEGKLNTKVHPIDISNKWIGREYFYALQPAGGYINYEVRFNGGRTEVNKQFPDVPTSFSGVFTGWYRVMATVNN